MKRCSHPSTNIFKFQGELINKENKKVYYSYASALMILQKNLLGNTIRESSGRRSKIMEAGSQHSFFAKMCCRKSWAFRLVKKRLSES
jgi:hypothetical protein